MQTRFLELLLEITIQGAGGECPRRPGASPRCLGRQGLTRPGQPSWPPRPAWPSLTTGDAQACRQDNGTFRGIENAWYGQVFNYLHKFCFQKIPKATDPLNRRKEWFLGLNHFPDSSILVLPVRVKKILNNKVEMFEIDIQDRDEPLLFPINMPMKELQAKLANLKLLP